MVQIRDTQQKRKKKKKIQASDIRENGIQKQEVQMQERIWETAFGLKPEPYKKEESLRFIQGCVHSKEIRNTPSPSELVWIQVQYITPAFWVLQGSLLFLLALFLYRLPGQGDNLLRYLWWGSIAAAWMGVLSNGLLGRHFSNGTAELEQSCYINLSQMWTIRMILTTGVDICILTIFSGGIAMCTDTFFGRVAMYLLVPFMLSNICCLLMISALRGSRGKYTLTALTVITTLIAMSPFVFPKAYTTAYLWVWFCLLVLGAAVFTGQMRNCYRRMTKGEIICWN